MDIVSRPSSSAYKFKNHIHAHTTVVVAVCLFLVFWLLLGLFLGVFFGGVYVHFLFTAK